MFRNERSMSGLKAQQPIAQGNALGRETAANAPCKGKSIRNQAIMKRTLLPLQGVHMIYPPPRALPWAMGCCPFGAYAICPLPTILYLRNLNK